MSLPNSTLPLILASQSLARQTMLRNAGLNFNAVPADIDEEKIVKIMRNKKSLPQDIALKLAYKKAQTIAKLYPEALIIGSDQILSFEDKILFKAKTLQEAREKLCSLRGKTHSLISTVSVVKAGTLLWKHTDTALLKMHNFSDKFLDLYCAKAGKALTRSVGAYELEAHGSWLFEKIEGNYFTILGLPLLPLLTYLKDYHEVHP